MEKLILDTSCSIQTLGLSKHFGNFIATDAITFEVKKGEIFGFLGANGAGKTTAMRMLTGLSRPTSGEAYVAGFNVYHAAEKIKQHIGYMSQKFSLYEDLTIMENIVFYGGVYGLSLKEVKRRGGALLEDLGFASHRKTMVSELPLGWKQKLAFSIALIHQPDIVFLDEPTGGVDPMVRRQFWTLIYKAAAQGITIFITTHYMDEAEYCNRISIMVAGKMVALGSPASLKRRFSASTMDEVFYKAAGGVIPLPA